MPRGWGLHVVLRTRVLFMPGDLFMTIKEIAWMAGLLEGEGYFGGGRKGEGKNRDSFVIALTMTDEDVIARAATLLDCKYFPRKLVKGWKPAYMLQVGGRRAAAWMMTLYPFMGMRRKARIHEALSYWRRAYFQTGPRVTHCKQGHEYTPENTYLCKPRGKRPRPRRVCKMCALASHKKWYEKRKVSLPGDLPLNISIPRSTK